MLPIYSEEDYCFNYKNFDLLEMYEQGYVAVSASHKILIADRAENCNPEKILGLYYDVIGSVYAVRTLEDSDITNNPKISEWILLKREAFDHSSEIIETETIRFSFAV